MCVQSQLLPPPALLVPAGLNLKIGKLQAFLPYKLLDPARLEVRCAAHAVGAAIAILQSGVPWQFRL